ncbi:ImpE protein [Caulifigura coniformis]|uniref:ImpE protein n=1 Tax=Caulifigura coniformis TaxID=2527983 RepID=A0A517SI55_9PLAN|nr:type VI secretion system accessory protein TagJ [Caulifigura coniformis]QDT55808.1 ImpE protein [Caulifigura coniformis]
MTAAELFHIGKLSEAVEAAIAEVKDQPGDLARRTLLFALLSFSGDLERARRQIDVVGNQAALSEAPIYHSLLAAEELRRKVLTEGLRPKFFEEPPARIEKHLQAIGQLAARQFSEAETLLRAAEEERPEFSGELNGTPFDDFADANDVTRSIFEFQQGRDYYWIPCDQLAHVQVVMPEPIRPRDLYWAPCQVILKSGATQRGFTPVMYVNSWQSSTDELKLGLQTTFRDDGGVYTGFGRKQFVAGEGDPTVFDLGDLTFA